jgi:uroporphyrin-III C-methyltransferase/precorrin-2 dehydrogenase/sirohydrochlorin ferrochelatase
MKYFPVFLNVAQRPIALVGGGAAAVAKLRLLLKTEADITVYDPAPAAQIRAWAQAHLLKISKTPLTLDQARQAQLIYAASEDDSCDERTQKIAQSAGTWFNWVDNLEQSQFITPAIVDRDPVTVAIGTEGTAPVVARAIKRDIEERLPQNLGALASIGQTFRSLAEALPFGRIRRDFWSRFYFSKGPAAYDAEGVAGAKRVLHELLAEFKSASPKQGHVDFVGAGPGEPALLTQKARVLLHEADVILHDRLVDRRILELARREATMIEVGKTGFGPAMAQEDIHHLIVEHVAQGAQVLRLKSGDPTVFGRLDEELEAIAAQNISYSIVPGITAASAAAAALGRSLTRRGRNSQLRVITGHDMAGYAERDWRDLAKPGAVAAIYMGKTAARFIQGRLLMHGADPLTPVSIIENCARPEQVIRSAPLNALTEALHNLAGPVVLLYGISPRTAVSHVFQTQEADLCL